MGSTGSSRMAMQDRGVAGDVIMAAANARSPPVWPRDVWTAYLETLEHAGVDLGSGLYADTPPHGRMVVLEGNIGSGKTTLAQLLRAATDATLHEEKFNGKLFDIMCNTHGEGGGDGDSDETIVFKRLAFQLSMVHGRVFAQRAALFASTAPDTPARPLYVFLTTDVDTCIAHIKTRGRAGEDALERSYLELIDRAHVAMALLLAAAGHDVVCHAPTGRWEDSAFARALIGFMTGRCDRRALPATPAVAFGGEPRTGEELVAWRHGPVPPTHLDALTAPMPATVRTQILNCFANERAMRLVNV